MAAEGGGDGDDALKTLLDMGFEEDKAKEALANHNGNAEEALEALVQLEKEESSAKASGPKSYR